MGRVEPTGMRADLHVHSRASGEIHVPGLGPVASECSSEPRDVYEVARRRGMHLVTLTDHDAIEGALEIAHLPGTFVSEELTAPLPGGRQLHFGVFDLDERQHAGLAARRHDLEALFAYLAEERLPFCLNHPLSALTGRREAEDFVRALRADPMLEVRNGALPFCQNRRAARLARQRMLSAVAGSDSHSLRGVGLTYTEVPGARSREDFLDGLRRGRTLARGRSGGYARVTGEVIEFFRRGYVDAFGRIAESPQRRLVALGALGLAPLLPLIPLVTAVLHLRERLFAARWGRVLLARRPRVRPLGATLSEMAR